MEGHRLFLLREKRLIYQRNLPWDKYNDLTDVVYCQLININFFMSKPVGCILTLLILEEYQLNEFMDAPSKKVIEESRTIEIRYYDLDNVPDFLVLFCRFKQSISRTFRVGDFVRLILNNDVDEKYEGKIVKRRNLQTRSSNSFWQCYDVSW